MTNNNCITEKRTFKQLTDIQRGMLEQMAKSGTYKQAEMARELGVSQPCLWQDKPTYNCSAKVHNSASSLGQKKKPLRAS